MNSVTSTELTIKSESQQGKLGLYKPMAHDQFSQHEVVVSL
jgi:hypothetical protein